jgi:hypothetical protein
MAHAQDSTAISVPPAQSEEDKSEKSSEPHTSIELHPVSASASASSTSAPPPQAALSLTLSSHPPPHPHPQPLVFGRTLSLRAVAFPFPTPQQPFESSGQWAALPFSPLWLVQVSPFLSNSDLGSLICTARVWRWAVYCVGAARAASASASPSPVSRSVGGAGAGAERHSHSSALHRDRALGVLQAPDEVQFARRVRLERRRNRLLCVTQVVVGRVWAPLTFALLLVSSTALAVCLDATALPPLTASASDGGLSPATEPALQQLSAGRSAQSACVYTLVPLLIAMLCTAVSGCALSVVYHYRRVPRFEPLTLHSELDSASSASSASCCSREWWCTQRRALRAVCGAQWARVMRHTSAGGGGTSALPVVVQHVRQSWGGLLFGYGALLWATAFAVMSFRSATTAQPLSLTAHPFAMNRVAMLFLACVGCVVELGCRLVAEYHDALRPSLHRFVVGQVGMTGFVSVLILGGALLIFSSV